MRTIPRVPSFALLQCLSGVATLLLLGACVHTPTHNPLAQWVPSPNHDARRPQLIVIHYTEQHSVEQSLRTLRSRNSGGPVSAHYLIGRDGQRYQLVDDERRAWHAGVGRWGTITDVNSASIGIELDNDGTSDFPETQIESLLVLLEDLCKRHRIPRTQVIGHSDMAPTRKRDPGPRFPWKHLALAGFGRWPQGDAQPAPPDFDALQGLSMLGYDTQDPQAAVRAWRMHFRADDGAALDVEDARLLHALTMSTGTR